MLKGRKWDIIEKNVASENRQLFQRMNCLKTNTIKISNCKKLIKGELFSANPATFCSIAFKLLLKLIWKDDARRIQKAIGDGVMDIEIDNIDRY